MVAGLELQEVEAMPTSALLDRARSWRRVDARRQLDAFHLQLAATRGDQSGVRSVESALRSAAGAGPSRRSGDVDDLQRWLTGGA